METLAFKLLIPAILIALSFLLGMFLTKVYTLRIDLPKAFQTNPAPPPTIGIKLNGVDGDSADIGFNFPQNATGSEKLKITDKNVEEIKAALSAAEFEKWDTMTKLPSAFFTFDLLIYSSPIAPNNGKKDTKFQATTLGGKDIQIFPGQTVRIGEGFKFQNLDEMLSRMQLTLISTGTPIYQVFYDKNGNFVPQSTGTLIIRPSSFSQILINAASLALIVALFSLLKTLVLSGKDVKNFIEHFSS